MEVARSELFARPFLIETDEEAVIRLNNHMGDSYSSFMSILGGEFPSKKVDTSQVYFSSKDYPTVFATLLTEKKFAQAEEFCDLESKKNQLREEIDLLVETPISESTEDGHKKTKVQLQKEESTKAKSVKQKEQEYNRVCYYFWLPTKYFLHKQFCLKKKKKTENIPVGLA